MIQIHYWPMLGRAGALVRMCAEAGVEYTHATAEDPVQQRAGPERMRTIRSGGQRRAASESAPADRAFMLGDQACVLETRPEQTECNRASRAAPPPSPPHLLFRLRF